MNKGKLGHQGNVSHYANMVRKVTISNYRNMVNLGKKGNQVTLVTKVVKYLRKFAR
jgi:hypothetical protein